MSDRIGGLHHITLCTGTAQGDVNFFVKALGMNLVKRTLLYDGGEPFYHLYFSDALGSPGNCARNRLRSGGRRRRLPASICASACSRPTISPSPLRPR